MVILCKTSCNMNKTHFTHTVNLYYISSCFWNSRYFPEKHRKLIPWRIWTVFVERYEIYLEMSFRTPLVFKSPFLRFIMSSPKEKIRIESHKTMTFLIYLLRRAIKPSRNYRNSTFSGYSLNIFVYCLEYILSQVSSTF